MRPFVTAETDFALAYKGDTAISRAESTSCQAAVVFVSKGNDKGS
jgi:hypothetical protein